MSLFDKWDAAFNSGDLGAIAELMHPECTMVMHSTEKVINLGEWRETFGKLVLSGKVKQDKSRCIYENDDIMVSHSFVALPNRATEAVMYVALLKDGKLFRVETGSTPLA